MNLDKYLDPPEELPHFEDCPQYEDSMADCLCRQIEKAMKDDAAEERRSRRDEQ